MYQTKVGFLPGLMKPTATFVWANWLFCLAGICILTIAGKWAYNVFFHQLSKYKGPWYFIASDVPFSYLQLRGTSQYTLRNAHDRYGDVVRIGPNTLSFINPKAWDDIYGYRKGDAAGVRKGMAALPKDPLFYNEMLLDRKTITMASDADAVPIRRAMNAAFSQRNLLQQGPMLREHMDRLVAQLDATGKENGRRGVDLRKWYTMSMFDINSDFGFGEDMGCVRGGKYHEWVQFVVDFFYAATLIHQCHKFWPLASLLAASMPKSLRDNQKAHNEASLMRVRRRMALDLERPDFMHHFMRSAQKEKLPIDIIEAQASIVILAGSETSAVGLTAATYHMLLNPAVYQKVRDQVRSTFTSVADVNLPDTLNKFPYLDAVIWEAFRIHTPLANGFTREIPGSLQQQDFDICGYSVPRSTIVIINHFACNTSAANFKDPNRFVPERWLGDPKYESDQRDVVQPFSVGPRNCPGKSFALNNIKFAMVYMITAFDMELCEGMESWGTGQKVYNGWLQPALMVSLQKRK